VPPGWPQWLAALLFGLLFVLLVLVISWMLRTCAPVDSALNIAAFESPAAPAPAPPPDTTAALRASLDQLTLEGKMLAVELAELQAELKSKLTECLQVEPPKQPSFPADRWARKDISILEGCWLLGRPVAAVRGDLGSPVREDNCTRTAGRICFGNNGIGQHEATTTCPIAGRFCCSAPIRAKFEENGTIHTTQPRVRCSDALTYWLPYEHTCHRVNDNLAVCRSSSFPGFPSRELEFRRAP
jgi:hypothetical protein